jgi:hypothetical protein
VQLALSVDLRPALFATLQRLPLDEASLNAAGGGGGLGYDSWSDERGNHGRQSNSETIFFSEK